MKTFNVILATDLNGGFALNNKLPWDLPIDFEFFKSITKHNTILPGINDEPNILIMGRKTWESMDCKPLFKRNSFVITSNFNKLNQKKLSNTIFFPDFISAYTEASHRVNSSVWVIGGKQIYDAALRHWACNKVYWTLIKGQFDADNFINMKDYPITWQSIIPKKDINKNDSKEYELDFDTLQTAYDEKYEDYREWLEELEPWNTDTLEDKGFMWDSVSGDLAVALDDSDDEEDEDDYV